MNIVVLLAGGRGERTGENIPKQFIEICGKPLIAHSLEVYEKSSCIDAVEVVCLNGYEDIIWAIKEKYNFSKLKWVTNGGESCQLSTMKGIFYLEGKVDDDDYVMLNMSTSVFINDELIIDSFRVAKECGNAFACMKCVYNNAETFDGISSKKIHAKETHRTINLPWTAKFSKFDRLYREAFEKNIAMDETAYAPTLFLAMGETLFFSKDTSLNKIHITTKEDIEIVTALLEYFRKREG